MLGLVSLVLASVSVLLPLTASTLLEKRSCNEPTHFPGFKNATGYIVQFNSENYTIHDHFQRIGQKCSADNISGTGYYAPALNQSQIDAVCSDFLCLGDRSQSGLSVQ